MPPSSIHERFMPIAEKVLLTAEMRTSIPETQTTSREYRTLLISLLELIIRTAALAEEPRVAHRQLKRRQAVKKAVEGGVTAAGILQAIRSTKRVMVGR